MNLKVIIDKMVIWILKFRSQLKNWTIRTKNKLFLLITKTKIQLKIDNKWAQKKVEIQTRKEIASPITFWAPRLEAEWARQSNHCKLVSQTNLIRLILALMVGLCSWTRSAHSNTNLRNFNKTRRNNRSYSRFKRTFKKYRSSVNWMKTCLKMIMIQTWRICQSFLNITLANSKTNQSNLVAPTVLYLLTFSRQRILKFILNTIKSTL